VTGLLDRMEEMMRTSPWLVGGRYSIADIAAVPFIKRIDEEIAPDEMTKAKHPKVAAWWAAIQARPAFVAAKIGPFTGPPPAG
jgi:glutathione S-transferase